MPRLVEVPGYVRFWTASAVSAFGSQVTGLALQILTAVALSASATEVGIVNAARWVPYLLFGLIAGVLVDRWRRKPMMVATDLGRAALLGAIPVLYALDGLTIPALCVFVFAFGVLSLLFEAASQSYVPQLVPKELLSAGYARVQQADAVAGSTGPLIAGVLIKIMGAPFAVLVDALTYLVSGLLLASVKAPDPVSDRGARRSLGSELREGVAWVYRHRTLASIALTSHAMLLFNSMVSTVFVVFALHSLKIGAFGLGITYACASVGMLLGGALSGRVARRLDVGATLIAFRLLAAVGWLPLVLAERGTWALASVSLAYFLVSLAIGIESPVEMSYRQAVTPDRLRGRMNATIRSMNWGTVAVGAPLGGVLADQVSYRFALWIGLSGAVVQALALAVSPTRRARTSDELGPASTDLTRHSPEAAAGERKD
ncbi:MFS transporter [Streptomyces turgidiscabies]|uniref:Transporter, major facilitator family protein n=1 Tax=Streptomyces turgidiscabies (strain Car8) TaxID=698760 RepID=L7F2N1_STRT8|nr:MULTISPECIES: MFS transporter [Streptomyces]ELP65246.1 transporter, major facilitator family protein [Streptomyces turgidiscabies Car8]MDX3498164.1 MFS transporter [Streptomyces turgidiscabies]GAQ75137.1 enterobactin exporter EntS [Streptomyces turgidiscabies]